MKKYLIFLFVLAFPIVASCQSVFKKGIQVGASGDVIDQISVGSASVTMTSPSYSHVLRPITAGAGLTLTGNVLSLGGLIGSNVTVSNEGSLYDFYLQTELDASNLSARLSFNDGVMRMTGYNNSTYSSTGQSMFAVNGLTATMEYMGTISGNSLTISSTGALLTTELSGAGLLGGAYYGASAVDNSFVQKKYVDDAIDDNIGSGTFTEVSYTECINADTTNITIGSTTTDISFLMHYTATRDMTFVLTQSGNIEVQYDVETGNVYYTSDYIGPDLYFSIEADYNGTNIRLNIIVTPSYGSGTNSVNFDYKITSKFYQ